MSAYNQSKVKMFRRCQKQYSFRYDYAEKLGLEPSLEMVPKQPSVPLKRGSWLHALQEAHHQEWAGVEGADWQIVHDQLTEEYNKLFEEERELMGDLPTECARLFRAYLKRWQADTERYTIAKMGNGHPAIEFVIEVPLTKWQIDEPFKGRIDLMVHDSDIGGLWIWDAKWVKTIPPQDERMMSPQALMYVWALRKLGYDVRGFVFNYGRTKPPTIPPVLKRSGLLTMRRSLDCDVHTYVEEIRKLHGTDWKEAAYSIYREKILELRGREAMWFRREQIPTEPHRINQALVEFLTTILDIRSRRKKNPPRSYFYNCKFSCGYHDLCVAEFNGLDIEPLIKYNYTFEEERYSDEPSLDVA